LEDLGLVAAMQYLVNQLAQSEGISVDFKIEGEVKGLPTDMEIAIYRILQESLNNIKKHANATEASVLVQFTEQNVKMIISDDGEGFEVPEAVTDFASAGSFGVMGLHERAQLFGGTVMVESEPGKGTTVKMVMPRISNPPQFRLDGSGTTLQRTKTKTSESIPTLN